MSIVIKPEEGEGFLSSFAGAIGATVQHGRVNIPGKYGSGWVTGFLFGKQLRMIVRNYVLFEEVVITRHPDWLTHDMVRISLNNILKTAWGGKIETADDRPALPSITIATNGFEPELHLGRDYGFNDIHIGIDASYLRELLNTELDHPILKNIVANDQPLIFEQVVSVTLQHTAAEIAEALISPPLHHFFYKLKAQELICYLLMELNQRKEGNVQALNSRDIKMLYAVKEQISRDLAKVPVLADLAAYAGISESKLKRLFKQVFGKNIYEFYQSLRMDEAAFLLKHKNMSVSEVGYALGFINMSHFSKVFEQYIGVKPKKFSLAKF